MSTPTPNSTVFPEIDLASKVAAESSILSGRKSSPLAKLLSPLSNSAEIRKRLARQSFVLYYPNISGPPVLTLERGIFPFTRTLRSPHSNGYDGDDTSYYPRV